MRKRLWTTTLIFLVLATVVSIYFVVTRWHIPALRWQALWGLSQSVLVVIVGLAELLSYWRDGWQDRRTSAESRFDHTIMAINFEREVIAPEIDHVLTKYGQIKRTRRSEEGAGFDAVIESRMIRQSGVIKLFKDPNSLAAYTQFEMVNPDRLNRNIADDMLRLMIHSDFDTIKALFQRRYLMNDFLTILAESYQYLDQMKKRRVDDHETIHRR